jgi:hypothetical protein
MRVVSAVLLLILSVVAARAAHPGSVALVPRQASNSGLADAQAAAAPQNYTFSDGAGMLFFYVKPEKTTDFEAVVARLADVLDKADDPVRKQQAASWHILKSAQAKSDAAVYVFVFDPVVAGADYDPVKLLGEKQPEDLRALYEKLRDATIRVERMGLTKLR